MKDQFEKSSWAQQGEDLIVDFLFSCYIKKQKVKYLDIGANAPKWLSNTYYFYLKNEFGGGILVEPNPQLSEKLIQERPQDTVLNCGVGIEESVLPFYFMDADTLNSFSMQAVQDAMNAGHKLLGYIDVKVIPIAWIFEQYGKMDFISIDVEGLDFEILKAIDYDTYAPYVICIETAEYGVFAKRKDMDDMVGFMKAKGYCVCADNYINTIFVKQDIITETIEKENAQRKAGNNIG